MNQKYKELVFLRTTDQTTDNGSDHTKYTTGILFLLESSERFYFKLTLFRHWICNIAGLMNLLKWRQTDTFITTLTGRDTVLAQYCVLLARYKDTSIGIHNARGQSLVISSLKQRPHCMCDYGTLINGSDNLDQSCLHFRVIIKHQINAIVPHS